MATPEIVLGVRCYTLRIPSTESHSFILANIHSGLTEVLGTVSVVAHETTGKELRRRLEICMDRGMMRRSLLFQELLFMMETCVNHFNRSAIELRHYRLGFVRKGDTEPFLIDEGDEDKPVRQLADPLFEYDLVVMPLSQIPPSQMEVHKDVEEAERSQNGET